MITRVIDEHGQVLHDCKDAGCTVSWDGYAIRNLSAQELGIDTTKFPLLASGIAKGDRVPNGADPDVAVWSVQGQTAKLKTRSG